MSTLFQIYENSYGALLLGGRILPIIRNTLNNFLPLNAHQLVSGKLHIILTRVRDCRNVVVSEFASREDLIQVRAASVAFHERCLRFAAWPCPHEPQGKPGGGRLRFLSLPPSEARQGHKLKLSIG